MNQARKYTLSRRRFRSYRVNYKYKDRLFRYIFKDKKDLLERQPNAKHSPIGWRDLPPSPARGHFHIFITPSTEPPTQIRRI